MFYFTTLINISPKYRAHERPMLPASLGQASNKRSLPILIPLGSGTRKDKNAACPKQTIPRKRLPQPSIEFRFLLVLQVRKNRIFPRERLIWNCFTRAGMILGVNLNLPHLVLSDLKVDSIANSTCSSALALSFLCHCEERSLAPGFFPGLSDEAISDM
jgi:hypothetical protein